MNFFQRNAGTLAAVALIIAIAGSWFGIMLPAAGHSGLLGGTTNFDALQLDTTLTVGGATTLSGASAFNSRVTKGGVFATTTTSTLLESQLLTVNSITFNPATAAITVTLPASSTLTTLIPNSGDSVNYVISNLATVAASSTTIAGGTGTTLVISTSTNPVINGAGNGLLTMVRLANTNVRAILQIFNQ